MIQFLNVDCREYMKTLKDNAFDLAIVDPPYGIGEDGKKNHSRGEMAKAKQYTPKNWDKTPISKEAIADILRVSKKAIIFGANHFIQNIPDANSSCWIVWDKLNGNNDFADCELAWTNFDTAVRRFSFMWSGMLQGNMKNKQERIHPTEKPIELYEWILRRYAKEGDKILDTHLGSGSSAIAAHNLVFEFVGCEIDKEYFDKALNRFEKYKSQLRLDIK
jgi:site-specific DNA-methyltransferase (adenine-specific)